MSDGPFQRCRYSECRVTAPYLLQGLLKAAGKVEALGPLEENDPDADEELDKGADDIGDLADQLAAAKIDLPQE